MNQSVYPIYPGSYPGGGVYPGTAMAATYPNIYPSNLYTPAANAYSSTYMPQPYAQTPPPSYPATSLNQQGIYPATNVNELNKNNQKFWIINKIY